MNIELVAIGSELLLGQTTDTNSVWVSEQLALAGIHCHFHSSVGDDEKRIVEVLRTASERSDHVICFGGLGPTQDDLTRTAIAELMNAPLLHNEELAKHCKNMFRKIKKTMPEVNLRQAAIPEGATYLSPIPGTAAGLSCPTDAGGNIYALPGVQTEMKKIFTEAVLPELLRKKGKTEHIRSRVLKTYGISESAMAEKLADRITMHQKKQDVSLAYLASGVEGLKIRITTKANSEQEAIKILDAEEKELQALIGPFIFATDSQTMESTILRLLAEKGLTLGVAESVTGGYISGRLCQVAGASQSFRGGIVAYSLESKQKLLGISSKNLINEETAVAMAQNVCDAVGSDIGIGITGVAGSSPIEGKPVGTVAMAVASSDGALAMTRRFRKDREHIRQQATIAILDILRRVLQET